LVISTAIIFTTVQLTVVRPCVRENITFPLAGAWAELVYPGKAIDQTEPSYGFGVAVKEMVFSGSKLGKVTVMEKGWLELPTPAMNLWGEVCMAALKKPQFRGVYGELLILSKSNS